MSTKLRGGVAVVCLIEAFGKRCGKLVIRLRSVHGNRPSICMVKLEESRVVVYSYLKTP